MTAAAPLVDVGNLSLAYRHGEGWLQVLHEVSFTIAKGEAFGLVGEFGSGKSSLAYLLLGYRHPRSRVLGGRVTFDGREILKLDRRALDRLRGHRIGFVPQNPTTALSPAMHVGRQIVEVLLAHAAASSQERAWKRAVELLGHVGLAGAASIGGRYPHELSGGQQQRVIIAMALACEPDMLVLDEPTTSLDVTTQKQIIDLLRELRRRHRMSMLYVTHDLEVLNQIADRVGVMYAGRVVESGPISEVFNRPRHPYTRGLIASIPELEATGRPRGAALRGLLRREDLPPGCAFYPRCDVTEHSCASNPQALVQVAENHLVACQRWEKLGPPLADPAETSAASPPSQDGQSLLSLEAVSLCYRQPGGFFGLQMSQSQKLVVYDVSFSIERGATFALVGESGSGKSTIARAIAGLLPVFDGRLIFEDQRLPGTLRGRSRDLRRRIQYIFQNPDASLNPRMRIANILARPLRAFFDSGSAAVRESVALALQDVRLDPSYGSRYPDQLSGGERQRVAIARALIADPTLLLCDEVLSALDVSVQASILELLRRLKHRSEAAMLFISHDLAVVRLLADRVGVLFRGHLLEIGDVDEIFAPPFHPYTHSLLVAAPSVRSNIAALPTAQERIGTLAADKGCPYAGRCPWQQGKICEEEMPPWRENGRSLRIRCHIPPEELSARAVWKPAPRESSPVAEDTRSGGAL